MAPQPPELITIEWDDDRASQVGKTVKGYQFFITTPFTPTLNDTNLGCEFIARYLFDAQGYLVEASIDSLGPRELLNEDQYQQLYWQRIHELGDVTYCHIQIRPFQVERFDTVFGLIVHTPRDDKDEWWVTVEPGDYMAFHEPWDSGHYDT
jgi:hypothetical protein